MNRGQKRAASKKKKHKQDKHGKEAIERMMLLHKITNASIKSHSEPKEFSKGDKVKLNVNRIESRPNYIHMNDRYKKFVSENADTVFTVKFEKGSDRLITFEENDEWLFWSGDLDIYEENTE